MKSVGADEHRCSASPGWNSFIVFGLLVHLGHVLLIAVAHQSHVHQTEP